MNETNYEEPSVGGNLVINAPRYLILVQCGRNFLNNLDATCEQLCMATFQGKWDTAVLSHGQVCILWLGGGLLYGSE